jgi:hypothetical protein
MYGTRSPIAKIALVLAGAVCLFTAENLWIEPWAAKRSHHRLPSFVPEALGGTWFLVLMVLGIAMILAVLCQVLLVRTAGFAGWKKTLTGIAVLAAVILTCEWFVRTGGTRIVEQEGARQKHTVVLHWNASSSKNVRYNIYRGSVPGMHPDKLNAAPVDGLTFTDRNVQMGKNYYYVARAVDAAGQESSDSNETVATIP